MGKKDGANTFILNDIYGMKNDEMSVDSLPGELVLIGFPLTC